MSNVPHPVAVKTFIWPAFFLIASVFCLLSAPAANADNITPQWVKIYNDPNNDYDVGIALAVDGDGNVVIGGRVYSLASSYDFYVAKYAVNTGTLIWEKYYDGPTHSDDEMSNMVLDADGNVFVTGSSFAQRGLADYYTAKYAAADGALLWEKRTDRGASSVNYPGTLAADANGNVVVTGASSATFGTNQYDFYTIKYSGTDGSVLWEKVYDGPNHGQEGVQAMAIDIHGDVIVAGGSQVSPVPPGSQADVVLETIKYSGADGSVLWEKRQSAPSGNFESATGMVIAPNGDVLTLAMTNSLQAGFDFYTARYAGTTGALLWEKSYNSPGNGTDFPGSIKSDSAGNAIVTGMADANGSADMYTVKYAVANGAVIWEKRYDGPTHQADSGSSILIDSSDNVIVVGSSGIAQGKGDVQIVKFAAATGVLMLDKGYNGPGNPIEYGGASAFTPDGGIAVLGGIEKIDGNHAVNDIFTIKFLPGTATEAPILTTPATNAITGSNIAVKFTLPDIATDGTVKLTFAGQATTILTLTNANSTLGIHTFALNSNALASSAQVASVEGPSLLPQGIYTVTLSYQDSAGHPAAAASSTNVSIDGVSPVLSPVTVASSNANPLFARVGDTVMVTFTSNEPLQTPTVKINNVAAGVADLGGNAWRGTLLLNAASPEGSATFSVTAKDTRNNAATVTAVTDGSGVIVDRTAPMLTVPGTQTAQAAGAAGAIVNFAANATDANPVAISYSKSPGSVFPLGNTTVTATATDAAGNTTSNNFTISVQDAIPPSITILGANPVTVEAAIPYLDAGATASDAVAGDLTAAIQTTGNVNTNAVGDYAVNYTVSDGFNSATATRTVKVRDTTPPVITILGANPATVEAGTAYNDAGATAGDTLAGQHLRCNSDDEQRQRERHWRLRGDLSSERWLQLGHPHAHREGPGHHPAAHHHPWE
jgi:hypothetical protein